MSRIQPLVTEEQEHMMTLIELMARSVGAKPQQNKNGDVEYLMDTEALERLASLVRADEREAVEGLLKEYDMANSTFAKDFRARSNT